VEVVGAWRAAPPFRLVRQADNPTYIRSLRASSTSLKHWVARVFIGWGICASTSVYEFCVKLLDEKQIETFAIFICCSWLFEYPHDDVAGRAIRGFSSMALDSTNRESR
jgi:hypothetical protein